MIDKFIGAYYNKRDKNYDEIPPEFLKQKGCVGIMKTKNVLKILLTVGAVLAALVAVVLVLVRTERRLYRALGVLESYLPRNKKDSALHIELEDI